MKIENFSGTRLKSLDALRGIAALQVALFHAGMVGSFPSSWLAVDLFFLLSGFVLAYRYFSNETFDLSNFISHRLARLYPLHLFLLFVLFVFYLRFGFPVMTDGTEVGLLQNLFLLQSVGFNKSGATWNMPSWSISVEFWVNILFVLIFIKSRDVVKFMAACFCYMLILRQSGNLGVSVDNYFGFLNNGLLRGMASFLLGVIAYDVYKKIKFIKFKIASVFEVFALVMLVLYGALDYQKIAYGTFLFIPLFFIIVLVFSFDAGVVSRIFRLLKVDYLGTISYGVYLTHTPILIIAPYFYGELSIYSYLTMTLAASAFLHYTVEKPCSRLLKDRFIVCQENSNYLIGLLLLFVAMIYISIVR